MKKQNEPKLRTEKTVLQVSSVIASSGKSERTLTSVDHSAIDVLQDSGLTNLKSLARGVSARPNGGDDIFLFEYDHSNLANQKPGRIVRVQPHQCREVDSGRTIYIQGTPSSGSGSLEILFKGNHIPDWTLTCTMADKETVKSFLIRSDKGEVLGIKQTAPFRKKEADRNTCSTGKAE